MLIGAASEASGREGRLSRAPRSRSVLDRTQLANCGLAAARANEDVPSSSKRSRVGEVGCRLAQPRRRLPLEREPAPGGSLIFGLDRPIGNVMPLNVL